MHGYRLTRLATHRHAAKVLQRACESCIEGFLDEDERFSNYVMMTFDDESDASQQLPRERLLKALTAVYDLIAAVLPPAGRRLVTRCVPRPGFRRLDAYATRGLRSVAAASLQL